MHALKAVLWGAQTPAEPDTGKSGVLVAQNTTSRLLKCGYSKSF